MLARDEDILAAAEEWSKAGRGVALATVVETWGSAPRPVGSNLVIDAEGNFLGSVSGGCVEGAVVTEAIDVIESGQPKMLEFGVAWIGDAASSDRSRSRRPASVTAAADTEPRRPSASRGSAGPAGLPQRQQSPRRCSPRPGVLVAVPAHVASPVVQSGYPALRVGGSPSPRTAPSPWSFHAVQMDRHRVGMRRHRLRAPTALASSEWRGGRIEPAPGRRRDRCGVLEFQRGVGVALNPSVISAPGALRLELLNSSTTTAGDDARHAGGLVRIALLEARAPSAPKTKRICRKSGRNRVKPLIQAEDIDESAGGAPANSARSPDR